MTFTIELGGLFQTPKGVPTLFWLTLLIMTLDVVWGYTIARMQGEANSRRLREGVMKRFYTITILLVITMFASIKPDLFDAQVFGIEVSAVWVFYLATMLAETKSLLEKADAIGLKDHPLIQMFRAALNRWSRHGKS